MTFTINWDKNGVYVKFNGIVTAQDLIDANNYVISNANFELIAYQIFDFLNIEDFKVTSYDINVVGSINKSQSDYREKMKTAFLTRDDYVREIANEYKQFMKGAGWDVEIFSEVDKLYDWINEK